MSTPPVTRRTGRPGRPGYDLDSLLAVAVKVFNEKGYDGTSMDVLADRLGLSKSSIYHHVSGKQELLELALNRALNALFAATTESQTTEGPHIDRLEHLVRRSVEILVAELPYVTLLLRVRGNTAVERRALARRREFDTFVSDLVTAAAEEGDLDPEVDPALVARLLFGTVNSLIEWYRPRTGATPDAVADTLIAMTFHGLRRS
ncbi:TetR family transcriptional regulator [Gordonia amarae]|uniref:TetR family transcriptional regulator n=2 Tax=Gordonia amarae TaxID=36821 RepID=A0A857KM67_9ACTN|nr:TetR/AcrR family transcriptional regulator [Gordonia amarae]MCS3878665.1 AcrR family transcriptional regulator [Gordonia amarae]QHN17257.1 TetR family transcriptional regulator [Gordonia amarae]QHN21783.1 TetR family transcriptional regulator [Gordonia amarae]QHN30634.1 TetR family transcriptional regulator [Gordonia amarae]QHN39411.1 TetR family transcriptional regulator [Gordonia amarae]